MKSPFDEMLDATGKARPHYQIFHNWLKQQSDTLMGLKRAEADLIFRRVGITFAVYGDDLGSERTIPFDQVPRIFAAKEWEQLEAGLRQRVKALNCFIYDVYHDENIIKAGIVPAEQIDVRQSPIRIGVPLFPFQQCVWLKLLNRNFPLRNLYVPF